MEKSVEQCESYHNLLFGDEPRVVLVKVLEGVHLQTGKQAKQLLQTGMVDAWCKQLRWHSSPSRICISPKLAVFCTR